MLVFLSGEREIRDTRDALRALKLPDTEILPLYARLSAAEQHRVFEARAQPGPRDRHTGHQGLTRAGGGRAGRIVLATNVAETSLTVPGIRYVIDPGTARTSRYSRRLKVQRLPIEPVSQASATQRAGRCGRTTDGICIRLYSAEDFPARPEFTDPEIVRTHLASVILQMAALNLGDVAAFGFIDPPDRRQISDGVTVHVPLPVLNQVDPAPFTWQVPGLREELVVALLKSLPKPLRRQLVPVPDYTKALLARMTPYREPLLDALERERT